MLALLTWGSTWVLAEEVWIWWCSGFLCLLACRILSDFSTIICKQWWELLTWLLLFKQSRFPVRFINQIKEIKNKTAAPIIKYWKNSIRFDWSLQIWLRYTSSNVLQDRLLWIILVILDCTISGELQCIQKYFVEGQGAVTTSLESL